jgi:hypothetical protein
MENKGFGLTSIKIENGETKFDYLSKNTEQQTKPGVWVERYVPEFLEDAVNQAINDVLAKHMLLQFKDD